MPVIKTAVSVKESLFRDAEAVAQEMGVARSQLYALALEEFLARRHNRKLLREINEAYGAPPDAEETKLLHAMRRHHRKVLEGRE